MKNSDFSIYLAPDGKNIYDATRKFHTEFITSFMEAVDNSQQLRKVQQSVHRPLERQIITILDQQKRQTWFHFETDSKEENPHAIVKQTLSTLQIDLSKLIVIETRHGYHYLIKIIDIGPIRYSQLLKTLFASGQFSNHPQGRIPVPGTLQNGFQVAFVDLP